LNVGGVSKGKILEHLINGKKAQKKSAGSHNQWTVKRRAPSVIRVLVTRINICTLPQLIPGTSSGRTIDGVTIQRLCTIRSPERLFVERSEPAPESLPNGLYETALTGDCGNIKR
jgi:hypothetical protein